MTDTALNPSQDPADSGTLTGLLRLASRKMMQNMDGMLPAKVISATSDRRFASVQPLIQIVGTDGSLTTRAQISRVPVFHIGAGSHVLSFPLKSGDLGWIVAADRDISLYLQSLSTCRPNTHRIKNFADAVFVPDAARNFAYSGDSGAVSLQATDGSYSLSLSSDMIELTHATLVKINCPSTSLTGDLTVSGDITSDGTVTGTTDVLGGSSSISLSTHTHSGVSTGTGTSGEPTT